MPDGRGRIAYGDDFASVEDAELGDSPHWNRWHYAVAGAFGLLCWGIYDWSLLPWVVGFVGVPTTIWLDIRYVESVTTQWQPDRGIYILGAILMTFLIAPLYLFRRWETVGL